jgi:hypothetical protein
VCVCWHAVLKRPRPRGRAEPDPHHAGEAQRRRALRRARLARRGGRSVGTLFRRAVDSGTSGQKRKHRYWRIGYSRQTLNASRPTSEGLHTENFSTRRGDAQDLPMSSKRNAPPGGVGLRYRWGQPAGDLNPATRPAQPQGARCYFTCGNGEGQAAKQNRNRPGDNLRSGSLSLGSVTGQDWDGSYISDGHRSQFADTYLHPSLHRLLRFFQ